MNTTINIAGKNSILIIILITATFCIPSLMAKSPSVTTSDINRSGLTALAPVTPKEATFDDLVPEKAPVMVSIAPATPREATFDDDTVTAEISTDLLKKVAPVTPAESDFDDVSPEEYLSISSLKFGAPLEASFTDF
jgi:hypothetical protein